MPQKLSKISGGHTPTEIRSHELIQSSTVRYCKDSEQMDILDWSWMNSCFLALYDNCALNKCVQMPSKKFKHTRYL